MNTRASWIHGRRLLWIPILALSTSLVSLHAADQSAIQKLRTSLTFHASFDGVTNAAFAKGDPKIYTLLDNKPGGTRPGLHTDGQTRLAKGQGLSGDALEFTARESKWLFYKADKNLPYAQTQWSGTVSLWLRLDPETDLKPGYCDPIQITTRQWNDAAFFVDFDKEGDPRDFRLGAFADLAAWNPRNLDVNGIPDDQRPLLKVRNPPFGRDRWTHVAFTWTQFNTGNKDGRATLYLNGEPRGTLQDWRQTFTWKADEEARILIGLNYIGLLDDLACFDRALTAEEIKVLSEHKSGLGLNR